MTEAIRCPHGAIHQPNEKCGCNWCKAGKGGLPYDNPLSLDYKAEITAILEEEAERYRLDKTVLEKVMSLVSDNDFAMIEAELVDGGFTGNFEIVNSPNGDIQDCDYKFANGYKVVNQTCNGGYTGDEYAGQVYIPISKGKWFKFDYCC